MKSIIVLLFIYTSPAFSQSITIDTLKNSFNPDSIYTEVDIPAEHPKGKEARTHFIERNIDAAIGIRNGAPAGTYKVIITCIIDTMGKIIEMIPATYYGYGMENEFIRVLKKMPDFKPAIKNGLAVKTKNNFPVIFFSRNTN